MIIQNSAIQGNRSGRGFASRPENINRKGMIKKGESLTDLVKQAMEEEHETIGPSGVSSKFKIKQILAKKIVAEAIKGNSKMISLLWNHHDGMPVQKIVQSVEEVPTPEDEQEFNSFLEGDEIQQEEATDNTDNQ